MDEELKEQIKNVLKDPQKRHKFEAALIDAAVKRARRKAKKLHEKAQENWPEVKEKIQEKWSEAKQTVQEKLPEVKQHVQDFVEEMPDNIQKAKDGAKKAVELTGKTAKNFMNWALKNNTNKALLLSALIPLIGGVALLTTQQSRALKRAQKEEKARLKLLEDKLNQRHQITDKESFRQLFNEALPLIQPSFLTSEVYVSQPYTDNGKTTNTAGIGSWWWADNYTDDVWVKTSDYVKQHPDLFVDGDRAMNMVTGWICYREGGRIYNTLYKNLLGKDISIREYLKLFEVTYNSERAGRDLTNEVFKNDDYKDPFKLAKCMMNLKYDQNFEDGLLRRNASQSADIIAGVDHCALHTKKIVQKNKQDVYVTSISVLPLPLCKDFKEALNNGDNERAEKLAQEISFKMSHWLCRHDENGQSALRQVQKIVTDTAIANPICRFAGDTLNVTGDSPYWGDVLYDQAREYNECGMFDKAADCYEDLFNRGFYGADLYLDAARNYYDKGDYDKCCYLCKKIYNNRDENYQIKPAYELAYKAYKQNNQPGLAKACKQRLDSLSAPKTKEAKSR